jgi:hypothetical protein
MAVFKPELGKSLDDLWNLASTFGDIRGFDPALAFDPSSVDALVGAKIPPKLHLHGYLDGMSNITGIGVYSAATSRKIELIGRVWRSVLKPPVLSINMVRGEANTILDLEVLATAETPRDRPGQQITLARVPAALLIADAAQSLAPEFYLETNLPEVQNLAQSVGRLLFDGLIDFHGASGESPHE